MFSELVESSDQARPTNKRWTIFLSTTLQGSLLVVLVLIPLIYTEALPTFMLATLLVAPPPPQPPPRPLPQSRVMRPAHLLRRNEFLAPAVIPRRIGNVTDETPAPDANAFGSTDLFAGLPNGLVVGQGTEIPPPPAERPNSRLQVGGQIQQAKLLHQVQPAYPMIARTAHVSGTVVLHAIIAKDGTIQELQYISGPPLLMRAAIDAVGQWRYAPTLLNGEPVEVDTTISVIFNLGN